MKELLYLKDEQIKDLIEQLFYAYRETFADSKKNFGKTHFWNCSSKSYSLGRKVRGNNGFWFAKKIKNYQTKFKSSFERFK